MHGQIDRDVQHLGTLGEVHAKEKDVAPAAMGEVHAHRGAFPQDRISTIQRIPAQEFGSETQRLIGRMAHAEHPLVPSHGTDAPSDLAGKSLKRQPMISHRQCARDGIARTVGLLDCQKTIDGFFETPLQQVLVTRKRDQRSRPSGAILRGGGPLQKPGRKVKAVNGIKEEERPDPFVEVFTLPPEGVQSGGFVDQLFERTTRTGGVQRAIAKRGLRGCDDGNEVRHS